MVINGSLIQTKYVIICSQPNEFWYRRLLVISYSCVYVIKSSPGFSALDTKISVRVDSMPYGCASMIYALITFPFIALANVF